MNYVQGMKQNRADAHEDIPHWFAVMPCQPLQCHAFLQSATDLLQLEQATTSPNQWRNGEGGNAGTPREQEQEHCMLSPADYFIGFDTGHKAT